MAAAWLLGATPLAAAAQQEVNFQRPIFTTQGTALCASQSQVASVNVVEFADGLEVATAQADLGGSCRVSLVGAGLSISAMASTPM